MPRRDQACQPHLTFGVYERERCVNLAILGGMPRVDDAEIDLLLGPVALALLGAGADSARLAAALTGDGISLSAERAARVLDRLARLGLARVLGDEDGHPRFVATSLGQRVVDAQVARQPELAVGLDELERLRTDLLSTIAHELRTPLTSLRTCVGLLLDPALRPSDDERQRLIATIARSSDRMYQLVEELLDLARYRAGKVSLERRRFDARALARDAASAVRPLAEAAGQELRLDLPPAPAMVSGDRRRLEQALLNLLSNAHKFSSPGGEIGFAVARQGDEMTWTVEDHGPGIAPEDQARLFERFFVGASDVAGGTGLGLPTALAIAQAHGGRIEVDSRLGRGSRFSLVVPADVGGDPA